MRIYLTNPEIPFIRHIFIYFYSWIILDTTIFIAEGEFDVNDWPFIWAL